MEEILVSWELRGERWEIWGREDLQTRSCLCFYRTFNTCLQCFSYRVLSFFFVRPPQLGYLAESERSKWDIRDHIKIILLWTSSQLCGYKYPAQMQHNIFKYSVLLEYLGLSSSFLSVSLRSECGVLAVPGGVEAAPPGGVTAPASAHLWELLIRRHLQRWGALSPKVVSRNADRFTFSLH